MWGREPSRSHLSLLLVAIVAGLFYYILYITGPAQQPSRVLETLGLSALQLTLICLAIGELLYARARTLAGLLFMASLFVFTPLSVIFLATFFSSQGTTFGFLVTLGLPILLLISYGRILQRYRSARDVDASSYVAPERNVENARQEPGGFRGFLFHLKADLFREPGAPRRKQRFVLRRWYYVVYYVLLLLAAGYLFYVVLDRPFYQPPIVRAMFLTAGVGLLLRVVPELLPRDYTTLAGVLRLVSNLAFALGLLLLLAVPVCVAATFC